MGWVVWCGDRVGHYFCIISAATTCCWCNRGEQVVSISSTGVECCVCVVLMWCWNRVQFPIYYNFLQNCVRYGNLGWQISNKFGINTWRAINSSARLQKCRYYCACMFACIQIFVMYTYYSACIVTPHCCHVVIVVVIRPGWERFYSAHKFLHINSPFRLMHTYMRSTGFLCVQ